MLRIAVLGCGRTGRMRSENIHSHSRATLAGAALLSVRLGRLINLEEVA